MLTLDILPHPITTEGRYTEQLEVLHGTTIADLLCDVTAKSDDFATILDGEYIPAGQWAEQELSVSRVLQVRRAVHGNDSNVIAAILTIVILIYAPQLAGVLFVEGTTAYFAATAVIGFAGVLAINTLFPPRTPDNDSGDGSAVDRQYSIAAGSNPIRTFQPLLLILGEHRVFPDFASIPYTELVTNSKNYGGRGALSASIEDGVPRFGRFGSFGNAFNFVGGGFYGAGFSPNAGNSIDFNAQFLYQLFDFGIGRLVLTDPMIGDTPLNDYEDVETDEATAVTLVAGNVDSVKGQDLETGVWISRRSPMNTTKLVVNIISQRYEITDKGDVKGGTNVYKIRYRLYKEANPGSVKWTTSTHRLSSPGGGKARNPVRRAFDFDVPAGRYDVETQLVSSLAENDPQTTVKAALFSLNYYQPNVADFTGRTPYAMKIRATGQIYGAVKNFSMMVSQHVPVPQPDGSWSPGATSNPAYLMRKFWIGFYRRQGGTRQLMAGRGIPKEEIDDDNLKLWGEFCVKEGLTCNLVLDHRASEREIETLIAQCGWATVTKLGGKYGVAWENDDQPMTAIYTPANIVAGSLNVVWDNESLADEIIGNYVDSESDYQPNTLRRTVPGVSTPYKPVTLALQGITNGKQAAKEINRTAAAQFYNSRAITFETGIDGSRSFITRGSVVGLAHGLVGGTVGGRVVSLVSRNEVQLSVPPASLPQDGTMWIWDTDGDTTSVDFRRGLFTGAALKGNSYHEGYVTLDAPIPLTVGYDGETDEEIIRRYKVALFDSGADLVTVRVTGITPSPEGLFRIVVRDELPEYYAARVANLNYRLRSTKRRFRAVPDNADVEINPAQWLFDEGRPNDDDGDHGDLYMDTLTNTIWRKGGKNNWRVRARSTGADTSTWQTGRGAPAASLGEDGNFYFNSTTGGVSRKAAGQWIFLYGIDGPGNDPWLAGANEPASNLGNVGQWYFRTANGYVYEKTSSSAWTFRHDVTGRAVRSVVRNARTGVVTVLYTDDSTDTFTAKDLTITNIAIDVSGNKVITFSDGKTIKIPPGSSGVGISSITRNSDTGTVTVAYDDSTTGTFLLETIKVASTTTLPGGGVVVLFSDGTVIDVDAPNVTSVGSIDRDPLTGVVIVTLTDGATQSFLVGDGVDGSGVEYVWRRTGTNSRPAAPATTSAQRKLDLFVPDGWTDEEIGTDPTFRFEWVSTRIGSTGNWRPFREPARIGRHQQELADINYRAWASGTSYAFGDTVWVFEAVPVSGTDKLVQSYYICRLAHTASSSNKPPSTRYWATAASTTATSVIRALRLEVFSGTRLHASWTAPTSGTPPFTYDIDVSINSRFTTTVQTYRNQAGAAPTSSEITLTKLTQGTRYYVRVRAKDSNNVAGGWVSENATMLVTLVAPGKVVNPVGALRRTGIRISWDLPLTGSGPFTYRIRRKAGGDFSVIADNVSDRFYLDTTAVRGTTYIYGVASKNSLGVSPYERSAPRRITLPEVVTVTLTNTSLSLGDLNIFSGTVARSKQLIIGSDGNVYTGGVTITGGITTARRQLFHTTNWVRPTSKAGGYEFRYTVTAGTGTLRANVTAGDWHRAVPNDIVFSFFLSLAEAISSTYDARTLTVKVRKVGTTAILATGVYRWTKS